MVRLNLPKRYFVVILCNENYQLRQIKFEEKLLLKLNLDAKELSKIRNRSEFNAVQVQ